MSEFEKQDRELIQMVGENHRRSNTTTFFGYVIREDQAQRFAAYEATGVKANMPTSKHS